ncbi:hypothetical protein CDAR_237071 [Caerostris darwini]|uniref:Uncharacterized protein n=1 Tax=Caerostris darwini TaxID=1538125 RepID=A0AAV4W117_9ARAC|nr:hypothetical protein CDAR_237071 [Caerostris darwini]
MNSSQKEMLMSCEDDVIYLDFTHGVNSYLFDSATVLVLDDKVEGFPVAFIVSHRHYRAAFKAIKKEATVNSYIMTGHTEFFCNAWKNGFRRT